MIGKIYVKLATCVSSSCSLVERHTLVSSILICRKGAEKLLGVLITVGEAVAYVLSGMYGDVKTIGVLNAVLIIL
jgi:protein transport protein SEC61 subunit alpha